MRKGGRRFPDDKLLPWSPLQDGSTITHHRSSRPEISVRFNPFVAPCENYHEHVDFIFESFELRDDFFKEHQKRTCRTSSGSLITPASATGSRPRNNLQYRHDRRGERAITARRKRQAPWHQPPAKVVTYKMSVYTISSHPRGLQDI